MIAFASSLDQAGPFTRDVTDAALLLGAMAGTDPCDSTSLGLPEPVELPSRTDLRGHPARRARGADAARGSSPACSPRSRRRSSSRASWARRSSRAAAARAARLRRLLPDRARRGVAQPRPLRRRPLRPARRGARDLLHMYTETREQGFGEEVKRRIMLGTYALSSRLLRRLLRPRAEGADADRARLRDRVRALRLRRHADGAVRRLRARREDRRPARDVPERLPHRPDVARRASPASRSRAGSPRACRSASSSPAPRSARTRCSTRRTRSSGDRLRRPRRRVA